MSMGRFQSRGEYTLFGRRGRELGKFATLEAAKAAAKKETDRSLCWHWHEAGGKRVWDSRDDYTIELPVAEANRVSYASKYAVALQVPGQNAELVTCEFAWQAQDVVTRQKGRRENMVDGTTITKTRHGQPLQRWIFDAEDVLWRSVYTTNPSKVWRPGQRKEYALVEFVFDRDVGEYTRESEEPVTLEEFFDANEHDDEVMDEADKIRSLPVGGEVRFGGGAAPLTAIRRVS